MITRFRNKLRLAGLEDTLQSELGLPGNASRWLGRLAYDCAEKQGFDLLSVRGDLVVDASFWQLERAGYDALLAKLGQEHTRFQSRLAQYRSSRVQRAA